MMSGTAYEVLRTAQAGIAGGTLRRCPCAICKSRHILQGNHSMLCCCLAQEIQSLSCSGRKALLLPGLLSASVFLPWLRCHPWCHPHGCAHGLHAGHKQTDTQQPHVVVCPPARTHLCRSTGYNTGRLAQPGGICCGHMYSECVAIGRSVCTSAWGGMQAGSVYM